MGGDVLSQTEVENLLSAMAAGGEGTAAAATAAPAPAAVPMPGTGGLAITKPREKVAPYDFKRPERVGKEQMRALQTLHEGFGRNFGAALSALLRAIVECPAPVIGAIDGHVRAGGMGLVGACDIVIAGPRSTFALTEARIGVAPAIISLTLLPKLAPRAAAPTTGHHHRRRRRLRGRRDDRRPRQGLAPGTGRRQGTDNRDRAGRF